MLDVDDYVRQLGHFFLVSAGQLYITLLIGQIRLPASARILSRGDVPRKQERTNHGNARTESRETPSLFQRAAIATLIGGIAAGIGIKAFAQGGGCGWHRGGFMAGPVDPRRWTSTRSHAKAPLRRRFDATDEQKQKLAPIVKQAAKDLLPLRERIRERAGRPLELLTQDSVDRTAIEALRAEHLSSPSRRPTRDSSLFIT